MNVQPHNTLMNCFPLYPNTFKKTISDLYQVETFSNFHWQLPQQHHVMPTPPVSTQACNLTTVMPIAIPLKGDMRKRHRKSMSLSQLNVTERK